MNMDWLPSSVPINAVSWTAGSLAMAMFVFKSYSNYKTSRNPIAILYAYIGTALGLAFLCFGLPGFFTLNPNYLIYTYIAADIFVQLGMLAQARLLWFIGLRRLMPFWIPAALTVSLSAAIIISGIAGSHVSIQHNPLLVIYSDQNLTLILKTIIYSAIPIPTGYFFISRGIKQQHLRARIKSITTGCAFILIPLAAIANNIFDRGSDTAASALQNTIVFALFFIINAWPVAKFGSAAVHNKT